MRVHLVQSVMQSTRGRKSLVPIGTLHAAPHIILYLLVVGLEEVGRVEVRLGCPAMDCIATARVAEAGLNRKAGNCFFGKLFRRERCLNFKDV